MSWLGVNLNESLTSIKGQLSNFTRDVLSEDFEGEEDDSQVVVPRDRIKELESLCQLQKHELEETKRARAEVEERLHAADIHAAHQTKLLRQQLQDNESELRILREKSAEWGWNSGDTVNHDLNDGSQNHDMSDGLNHHNHLPTPSPGKLDLLNQQLSQRVEELERELGSLRDSHQEQIVLLQDQHRQQVQTLRSQHQQDGAQANHYKTSAVADNLESEDGLPERSTTAAGEDVAVWEQQRNQLEAEKEALNSRVDVLQRQVNQLKLKADEADELQKKFSDTSEECSRLRSDNEQHVKSLEELDIQHQTVVDQIIKKKKNIQDELQTTKEAYEQVMGAVERSQTEGIQLREEVEKLTLELQNIQESSANSLKSVQDQLDASVHEKADLESQLIHLKNEESNIKEQLQQVSTEKSQLCSEKIKLEKDADAIRSSSSTSDLELEKLKKECLELQDSNSQLRSEVESIRKELDGFKESEAVAQSALKVADKGRLTAEAEVGSLNSKLESLADQLSSLTVKEGDQKVLENKVMEREKEQEALMEKVTTLENEKQKLEVILKKANEDVQDAKSQSEILQSQLQAKGQEFQISNEQILELQGKLKNLESEVLKFRTHKNEDHDQIIKLLTTHNIEVTSNMGTDIHKVAELVRDSIWQRDTLERHVSSIAQELREKKDQLQEAESTRVDLERECEDLRDQLEEVQKGVRPQPEGSSRGLPTIEEESEGCGESEGETSLGAQVQEVRRKCNNDEAHRERESQIIALQAQVEALSEARGNLETEVSNLRSEREMLHGQLRESEGRTGNLLNLETEAASLRAEKSALVIRLSSLTQQVDLESVTLKDERDTLEEQVSGLEQQILGMQAEMLLNKHERESIGQQLLTQYEIQESREATVRVLEGEIEGLKEKLKEKFIGNGTDSDTLSQLQAKEVQLMDEVNSLRSQLIFKDDKVDALSQILEAIGQTFELKNPSHDGIQLSVQNTYRGLQSQLAEQKLKIEEIQKKLQNELDQSTKNSAALESECSLREEKGQEIMLLKEKLEKSEMELFQLREKVEELSLDTNGKESELTKLLKQLKDLEAEKREASSILCQTSNELSSSKEENIRLIGELESLGKSLAQLQQEKGDLDASRETHIKEIEARNQQITDQLAKLQEDSDRRVADGEAKISALQGQLSQLQRDKGVAETIVSENEKLVEREHTLQKENERLLQENKSLQEEREQLTVANKDAFSARDLASQQCNSLQVERDQMIATITQKHQESVTYHGEIQRLMQVLNQTVQSSTEEKTSLLSHLTEKESNLNEREIQVTKLREELEGLKKVREDLQKNVADDIIKKTEMSGLRKELESLQSKYSNLEQERDHLRVANAHFNTQYQDQSKELSSIREKEGRLSTECERLRQHLVTVEESYTAEVIKAEERESTLRSTLSKMEEKLNNHSSFYSSASQRASVQVETMQEQVRDLSAERDDAIHRLHAAEENAEQNQQSLATLQQVLQDFQKSQAREISEATERMRRQLEEEQQSGRSMTSQVESLKAQLAEVQSALGAASRLGEQLDKKEQMIIALKAQVTSQEEVARKARDDLICLKTSSEGKIEKNLLRNLFVGYFATPTDKRQEVLRVIAEVLNFSGEERNRTGLDFQGKSWLTSIANFLAPPASNVQITSKVDVLDHTSLSQAFIRFLEDESSPRPQARLPAVQMAQKTEEKAEKKAQAKAQAANKINPFVSTVEATANIVETSTDSRSSPLLAAASAPPTLPTFTPLAPSSPSLVEVKSTSSAPLVSAVGVTSPVSTNKYLTNLLSTEGSAKDDVK